MDIDKELQKIFEDDDLGLLEVKPKICNQCTPDERLAKSFEEINSFIDKNGKEPQKVDDILEKTLYYRWQGILQDPKKIDLLQQYDRYNILAIPDKEPETIDDIFSDDELGLLEDDADIFTLKNVPKQREETDFVAKRKPCKNFAEFEKLFIQCQKDLKYGVKTFEKFNENQITEGQFFVLNGVLLYVHKLFDIKKNADGKFDGRTHIIFENGTESNMLFRSLGKSLLENGKHITNTVTEKMQKFYEVHEDDKPTGYIYVLKSLSKDEKVKNTRDLYKIGFCETTVAERIKNAAAEVTYLMAPVKVVAEYQTFNMNTQKFELLLHKFFGHCCVAIDVFDNNGTRHTPREWFQIPCEVINHAVNLIISGEVVDYKYDKNTRIIGKK